MLLSPLHGKRKSVIHDGHAGEMAVSLESDCHIGHPPPGDHRFPLPVTNPPRPRVCCTLDRMMRPVPVVSTPLWRESWSIMRCRVFVLFAMLGFLAMAAPAKAQEGPSAHPTECAEFTNQAAAQTYFDAQGADYQNFDADGNGVACDEADTSNSGSATADSSDKADSVVSALPTTGSGPMSETNAVVIALIGAATLLAGCAAMAVRRMKIGTA